MVDYESMYQLLFHSVTRAVQILTDAQKDTERLYVESDSEPVIAEPNLPTDELESNGSQSAR